MAWIELRDSIATNKKTMRLKRILKCGTAEAVGHMCLLWLWAIENAPSGDLSDFLPQEIAEAAHWSASRAEDFVDALQQVGYIDEDGRLHDWGMYAGDKTDLETVQISKALYNNYNNNISECVSECVLLRIISNISTERLTYIFNYIYKRLYSKDIHTHSLIHKDYMLHNPNGSTKGLYSYNLDVYKDNTDIPRAREKESLRNFIKNQSKKYLGRDPIHADLLVICEGMQLKPDDYLTDDQCFLLETAYKQAWKASKGIPYVRGCLRNFARRGIKTREDYILFNESINGSAAGYPSSDEFFLAALKASMKE